MIFPKKTLTNTKAILYKYNMALTLQQIKSIDYERNPCVAVTGSGA